MVEFKDIDEPMVNLQRKDTNKKLENVSEKQLKYKFSPFVFIFASLSLTPCEYISFGGTNIETTNETNVNIVLSSGNKKVEDGVVSTKCELGLLYGMLGKSAIGKEVDEQIEAYADWCTGKTVEAVKTESADEENEELLSSVSIDVTKFNEALEYAYNHKTTATYELTGTAGIGMVSTLATNYYKNEPDISVDLAGVIAKDGVVEAALIDAVVFPLVFAEDLANAEKGQEILPLVDNESYYDENEVLHSKKDLGDKYAMADRNSGEENDCTLEWYEQAAIVEEAAIGCTAEDISNFVANEGDLSGATIALFNYFNALAKATNYAGKALISERLELQ